MSSKSKSHKKKSFSIKEILSKYIDTAFSSLKALPVNGYRSRSQLVNECPKQIANVLEKMQLGIQILELIQIHFQSEYHINSIKKKLNQIQKNLNDGSNQILNKIIIPQVYNQAQESDKQSRSSSYLSGTYQYLQYNNYLMGNQKYPFILDDQIESQVENNLLISKEQYEFLFRRKILQLHLPNTVKNAQRKGPSLQLDFNGFQLFFELRPLTFQKDQQKDLYLYYQNIRISRCPEIHENRINEIIRQKIDFTLNTQTERHFITYLEYLFKRVEYGYFYLERIYQYTQQNKQNFVDVKYQFNNMNLKFYYAKQYEFMDEIMGENGQFQVSLLINKLNFDQFVSFSNKKALQRKLTKENSSTENSSQNGNKQILHEAQDQQIIQINVYGSRFNSLNENQIKIPKEYDVNEDINIIMKYIQHSVYSLSTSSTAFANFELKLFSKSYYQLVSNHSQINIKKQGKAKFIIFPQYHVKVKNFKKDFQKIKNFNEKKLREIHQQEQDIQTETESEVCSEVTENLDNQEQNYFINFIAQIYVYQQQSVNKIKIRNIKGEKIFEINQFTKKHLSKSYQNQVCVRIIKYIILSNLNVHQYSMTNQADLKYYYASKHTFTNKQTQQTQTIKVNLDFSDPSHISILFITIIEDQNSNEKIVEEFQFEDLVKRFSYSNQTSEEEDSIFQDIQQNCKSENDFSNQQISYEKLELIFDNFIHFVKQQITNETFLYKDALVRTFQCSSQQLQIQVQICY